MDWYEGRREPDELLVRYDPALSVSLDLALGEGLVSMTDSGTVQLTMAGKSAAATVHQHEDVLLKEKEFLDHFPKRITQKLMNEISEWV